MFRHFLQPILAALLFISAAAPLHGNESLGEMWGTAKAEEKYYPIVDIPIPTTVPLRPGGLEFLPDGRLAVGTRRGDIYFIKGITASPPAPEFHLFASGQDEIFSLAWREGAMLATSWGELTRIRDLDGDEVADSYEALSAGWGYGEYHEFAFASKPDPRGDIWIALGLSSSYVSNNLFRGWVVRVTPQGEMIPVCSGLRSPAGVGPDANGTMFTVESQGPWNGCNSLKPVIPGAFLGHPASYNWYPFTRDMKAPAVEPATPSRMATERARIKELVPPAVLFPYIKMGRSLSGFRLAETGGKFGPFDGQIFIGDYTQSIIVRATTEKVNGVWQGACYPFREGLATGIMNVEFSPQGQLIAGGFTTNRQWPVRGERPFALQRIDWSGITPFEIREIRIQPDGFVIDFTLPIDPATAADTANYKVSTYTHIYHAGYGSPEVDHTHPTVTAAEPAADGMSVRIRLDRITRDHIHDFDLSGVTSRTGEDLLHRKAYYTVNEIPQ
ncbi:MAG: hypothetical protein MUF31_10280 [Akkermansiaceae bacterium]|jgi:hypothetical protein|nr:hypothetical protein [Akkermansiaceae bacterium]